MYLTSMQLCWTKNLLTSINKQSQCFSIPYRRFRWRAPEPYFSLLLFPPCVLLRHAMFWLVRVSSFCCASRSQMSRTPSADLWTRAPTRSARDRTQESRFANKHTGTRTATRLCLDIRGKRYPAHRVDLITRPWQCQS